MEKYNYSDIQLKVFRDRYAFGEEQYPHEAWSRVAAAVAEKENDQDGWSANFYKLLEDFRYVPGGRILAGMGTGAGVTASNCFVLPNPADSRDGIMDALREWVEIQSKGGGVGINLSSLRPRGSLVKGVNGQSSGPVSWAQPFAFISKSVIQQGGTRRGAAMIMLDCDHPDIFEFIHAKETPGVLEGCNISVCISDAFMAAVKADGDWDLKFGDKVYSTVKARQIWDEICEAAWASAEPGIYFMDRANKEANSGYFEELVSTNPCGEQPLGPYGACLLGSFNLNAFITVKVEKGKALTAFDYDKFRELVGYAVRFNDNVIDLSNYPLPACEDSQQRIRRMGIGVMGLADALINLKLRYGSVEAERFTTSIFRSLRDAAYAASADLARRRGSFPEYVEKEYLARPFVRGLHSWLQVKIKSQGIRNCYLLTQAPTGSTSLLAGVNSGIEPYFDFDYLRSDRLGEYDVTSEWADLYNSEDRPDYLVTSLDVTPEEHVAMQAAAQTYNDSSISKTVNGPESHTVEDVQRLYMLAYDKGLKSISYYRDNSRHEQVLYHKADEVAQIGGTASVDDGEWAKAPLAPSSWRRRMDDTRNSITHRFSVDGQTGYLTVGLYDDGTPGEVFVTISKEGSTLAGIVNWGATMLSIALQHGAPLETITEKMIGTQFEPAGFTQDSEIRTATSILDYIGRWLNSYFLEKPASSYEDPAVINAIKSDWLAFALTGSTEKLSEPVEILVGSRSGIFCPDCNREVIREEGCMKCRCGWSRC